MLTGMLWKTVKADPRKAAIVQGGRRIVYDELLALTGRFAAGLRRLGVEAGDCVAVFLPNCPELVVSLFACARLRAVMLPLDPWDHADELRRILAESRARIVITSPSRTGFLTGTSVTVIDFEALLPNPVDPMPVDEFRGPVLYLYTSGSTDARKRLCCTQENLYWEGRNFTETVGLTAADNILCTIPLCHSYGIGNCIVDAVYTGATLALLEPEDIPFAARSERVLELIRREAIRFYPAVPYQFQVLAALPDHPETALEGLKLCVSSGDVLPRQTYECFLKRFGRPIRSLYGSTEAGSISINTDPAEVMQPDSLGTPLRNVEIRIRDVAGRDLLENEVGQIWVKSAAIPPGGYDNRPELTAQTFRHGYYNTGDLGKIDSRGHLIMAGRKESFVDVGGYKVDIGEVEEVLQSHPQVREAAVTDVEIPGLGTLIKAVVVAHGACRASVIISHCRERLAAFKVPHIVEFRVSLPRSPLGKVRRTELGGAEAYPSGINSAEFKSAWLAAAKKTRALQIELLAAQVQEQVAWSLQRDVESVTRSESFHSMGLDSIRTAELQLRLVELTGLQLPITLLWNYPSIDELAVALWTRLNARAQPAVEPAQTRQAAAGLDELLSEVERRSGIDVEALLRAK